MLTIPDRVEGFIIYSNVSGQDLGVVLKQHGKVMAYASRQLIEYDKNYSTNDFALVTIVFVLKI